MEPVLTYEEYHLYQKLRRPVGDNHILKNHEEYNEYWDKIDWIRDWIKKENVNREKEYKQAVCKSRIYNTISILMLFVAITLPFPLNKILEECFHIYISTSLFVFSVVVLYVAGVWFSVQGGGWNERLPKKPCKVSVFDLLNEVSFGNGTPLALALAIVKSFINKDFICRNFRLCGSKYWDGLQEPALYMLLADALILDECLSKYSCEKECVKCKAKGYNDGVYYHSHWRNIYNMSPTDILRVYCDEYLGYNGSKQSLPKSIEDRERV